MPSEQTLHVPEAIRTLAAVLIAEVDLVGGTKNGGSGWSGPAAPDTYEFDTSEGWQTVKLPAASDAAGWAALGAINGTFLTENWIHLTPFFQNATIPTNEHDFGASVHFMPECWDNCHRSDVAADNAYLNTKSSNLNMPMFPHLHDDETRDAPTNYGPKYLMDEVTGTGKPKNPLRFIRWEVRVSDTADMEGNSVPWEPYMPGMWLKGRYFQARLIIEEETGYFRVRSGEVLVRALFPRRIVSGSVAWPTNGVAAPGVTVTLPVHPITGGSMFPNAMYVVASCQGNGGTVAHIALPSGHGAGATTFKIMVRDSANAQATTADTIEWAAFGY